MNALRRKLLHGVREVLPHDHYLALFATAYAAVWGFLYLPYTSRGYQPLVPVEYLCGLSCIAAAGYGLYRVSYFHPALRPSYAAWLAHTPWRFPQTLPNGPLLLMWKDAVLVTVLAAVVPGQGWYRAAPALAFVAAYSLATMLAALRCREPVGFFGLLVLVGVVLLCDPFGLYRPQSIPVFAAVAGAACALDAVSLRLSLMRLANQQAQQATLDIETYTPGDPTGIGWPLAPLLIEKTAGVTRRRYAMPAAATVAWLTFCTCSMFFRGGSIDRMIRGDGYVYAWPFLFVAMYRTGWYCSNYPSPISLVGRIATRRLIIPRYDAVFLAPLAIVAVGLVLPWQLENLGAPFGLAFGLPLGLAVWIALAAPPTLQDWRLTGAHRIARPPKKRKSFKLE
ncbi:hypothetical protein Pla175_02210 [Pirellulimonas nuda]|uniref:Uncharacterized protein n=1 Tax=Pirellulimonas nuda TaxID=2528009 RepID=A0A518D5X0_9BACT|nr:hypothetical protein [Pirellulimonas nuda]QDU86868.1 hypothetical protein Pla175_02210 [Pirellulimonas nuda]